LIAYSEQTEANERTKKNVITDINGAIILGSSTTQCVAVPECLIFIIHEPDSCKRTYHISDRIEQLNIGMRKEKQHIFDSRSEIRKARTSLNGLGIGIAGVSL